MLFRVTWKTMQVKVYIWIELTLQSYHLSPFSYHVPIATLSGLALLF